MEAKPSGEFPYSFDWIQLGAVWRKKLQSKSVRLLLPPVLVEAGVMIPGVVSDHHDAAAGPDAGATQVAKKAQEGGAIELVLFAAKYEPAIAQADRAKVPHALAGGGVEQHGIFDFGRNPHSTTRTVLLKMYFVGGPQVH